MTMFNNQADANAVTPMPCDRVDDTSVVNTSSAEAVVWYYLNSSAWAAAAGQAAGTVCMAKLTYTGVLNSIGSAVGTFADTSLTFAAATRVATLVTCPEELLSEIQSMSETNQIAKITPYLISNGDYIIDHRRGQIWMKSKATVANDAATYKYATPLTGGGTGDKVDLIKIGGVSVIADDGAFTAGTSTGIVAFGFADETTTDSVNEGDVGALRMTLDRKLITAPDQSHDDAVTAYASMQGLEAKTFDGSALPNTVSEGDIARQAGTTSGIAYSFITTQNGGATPLAIHDNVISASNGGNALIIKGLEGRSSQATAVASADAVRAVANLYGEQVIAGYDWSTQSNSTTEASPLSTHHVEETLCDLTNITSGTTGYLYIDMDGFKYLGLQIENPAQTDTCTVTLEATIQDDGTAAASCAYQDVTAKLTGAASYTADAIFLIDTPLPVKYLRVKYVTAGGNNTADLAVYAKKSY